MRNPLIPLILILILGVSVGACEAEAPVDDAGAAPPATAAEITAA